MITHGQEVEVLKDFMTGDNIAIRLPGKEGTAIQLHEVFAFRVNVSSHKLKFIVRRNPFTDEWKAVALMTPEFESLPLLPRRF